MKYLLEEKHLLWISASIALFIYVSISLSIINTDNPLDFVLHGFQMFGLPISIIIAGMLLKVRACVNAGAALGFSLSTLLFYLWTAYDGSGWLLYWFLFPLPCICYLTVIHTSKSSSSVKAFLVSLASIPTAMYVNFLIAHNF
jgi:hypothetical protein